MVGMSRKQEALLTEALAISSKLLEDVGRDVLTIPVDDGPRVSSSNRSTIGVMLSGCKVSYTHFLNPRLVTSRHLFQHDAAAAPVFGDCIYSQATHGSGYRWSLV